MPCKECSSCYENVLKYIIFQTQEIHNSYTGALVENFGVEKLVEFSVLNFAAEGGCCLALSGRTCLYQGGLQRILIANTCHYHLLLRFFEVEDGVRNCFCSL